VTTLDVCYTLKLVCVSDTRRITSRGLCSESNKSTDGYSAVWLRPGLRQFEVGGSDVVRVVLERLGHGSDHEFTVRFNLVRLDGCGWLPNCHPESAAQTALHCDHICNIARNGIIQVAGSRRTFLEPSCTLPLPPPSSLLTSTLFFSNLLEQNPRLLFPRFHRPIK
jgi:hypothetical protein